MKRRVIFTSNFRGEAQHQNLNARLADLGRANNFEVDYSHAPPDSAYSELVLKTIHDTAMDVSELGTSYTRDFVVMNALRPFSPAELTRIGNADTFLKNIWDCGMMNEQVWAIPWLSDVRLVFYRRDLLAKAGVNEADAFSTPHNFEQTLRQLKEAGVEFPWTPPTMRGLVSIQSMSSWVGYYGGQFIDEVNKKVVIDQPETIAGLQAYYQLHKYLGSSWKNMPADQANDTFLFNGAAVTISGPWSFPIIEGIPELLENVAVAAPLGKAFIGGSSLAIWNKGFEEQASIDLVEYLTSEPFQDVYPATIGMLPARRSSLEKFPFLNEEVRQVVIDALENGLESPDFSLWGLIENRLATSLAKLWQDILSSDAPDVEALVTRQMKITARRLNLLIEQH